MPKVEKKVLVAESWNLEGFYATLRAQDRSPSTLRAYRSDLEQFVAWAGTHHAESPEKINKRLLREYLAHMTERGDERTSIMRRRASLRSYFVWLVERGHLSESPAARLSAPRPHAQLPKIVV
ncbi:MAG: site-specific integrase, partial [Acidimicrobiales bacterium]